MPKVSDVRVLFTYTVIIFCVIYAYVLYGCETWSLTLREERRLRVFENRVLRRIFGPKRDEVTGEWRKLRHESFLISTLHQMLFRWPNQEERDGRRVGHVWGMGEVHTGFWWGDLGGKRSLARSKRWWEDKSKLYLKRILPEGVDWIDLAQDRDKWRAVVNAVMNLRVPWNAENFFNSWGILCLSDRASSW